MAAEEAADQTPPCVMDGTIRHVACSYAPSVRAARAARRDGERIGADPTELSSPIVAMPMTPGLSLDRLLPGATKWLTYWRRCCPIRWFWPNRSRAVNRERRPHSDGCSRS